MKNLLKTSGLKQSIAAMLLFYCSVHYHQTYSQQIFAHSDGMLISFDATLPSVLTSASIISGITAGQTLEGMDFRPATGQLYALGYNRTLQEAQLYVINTTTAVATAVNTTPTPIVLGAIGATNLQVGFDFNPTVDRIRVVSSRDFNYRLNPDNGLISFTDLALNYGSADVNFGANPFIAACAYTNSYIGATSTALYDLDTKLRILTRQDPPNNGTLLTIGSNGVAFNKIAGTIDVDIYFDPISQTNLTYVAYNPKGYLFDKLGTMNLTTGLITSLGAIGDGIAVQDIAVLIDRSVPALTGNVAYAVNTSNFLLSFDTDLPTIIRTAKAITGVTIGQTLIGLDYRPATSQLYALGYNSITSESQLYTINETSAVASVVNTTPTILTLGGTNIGFDFNPTVDKIRIVGANNKNYRLNVDGTLAFTDLDLNYDAADINFGADPMIGACAYTNSFAGSTITALYNFDQALNSITNQNPPNDGKLLTIGEVGFSQNLSDATNDMDIYFDGTTNFAYLNANSGIANFDHLYALNLTDGSTLDAGKIGYGIGIRTLALTIMPSEMRLFGSSAIIAGKLKINVLPNPAHNMLKVQVGIDAASTVKIVIYDLLGNSTGIRFMESASADVTVELNISDLLPGNYMVKVTTNTTTTTRLFSKI